MAERKGISGYLFTAAIFIALEVAALAMLRNASEVQNNWISRGADSFNACVWGSWEKVRGYFGLRRVNDSLAVENFRLRQQLARLDSSLYMPEDLSIVGSFHSIPARIVRHNSNSQHNVLLLDRGGIDNVIAGSGVVSEKGVVGIIDAVSEHYAHVLSFCNSSTVVSARVGRNGAVGQMRWDGISSTGAVLSEIPPYEGMMPGDTVFTSGFSSIFPADIPLGLTGESKLVNGATLVIKVRLFEDIRRLRYVTIVSNNDRAEIENLLNEEGQ